MLETEFRFGEVRQLASQVEANSERVTFRPIFSNGNGGVSLLAFRAGQELAEHVAPAELMVTVLEGEIVFSIGKTPHTMRSGDFMLVGEGVAHSVLANADSKVMLTKVKA